MNTLANIRTVLLGAGASAQADIPMANEMVVQIYDNLKSNHPDWKNIKSALDLSIAGVQFSLSTIKGSPFSKVGIEDLYTTLLELAAREENVLAPFVGSWSQKILVPESASIEKNVLNLAIGLEDDLNINLLNGTERQPRSGSLYLDKFRQVLKDAAKALSNNSKSNIYGWVAQQVLNQLVQLTWLEENNKVKYLLPLIESSKEKNLRIATLNYDNSIELAAKSLGIEVDTGLKPNQYGVNFDLPVKIALNKIHGSVNWLLNESLQIEVHDNISSDPALIFGAGNKLRAEGPYLELLLNFRNWLNECNELEICGYSFRDKHINALILSWFSQKPESKIIVIDPYMDFESIANNFDMTLDRGKKIFRSLFSKRFEIKNISAEEWLKVSP
jgi:hypothetical protein